VDPGALLRDSGAVANALIDAVVRGRVDHLNRMLRERLGEDVRARDDRLSIHVERQTGRSIEVSNARGVSVGEDNTVRDEQRSTIRGAKARDVPRLNNFRRSDYDDYGRRPSRPSRYDRAPDRGDFGSRSAVEIAGILEMSTKSAYQSRRASAATGRRTSAASGPEALARSERQGWTQSCPMRSWPG
jgi:hypothetical protein